MGKSQRWLGERVAELEGRAQPYGQRAVSKWLRDTTPKALFEVARALGLDYEELRRLAAHPGGVADVEQAPYEAEPPLTIATFLDEGTAALQTAFREAGLPYNSRAGMLMVADWWTLLTEERGLAGQNRIMDPAAAADLRAALAREVRNAVRTAGHLVGVTPSV